MFGAGWSKMKLRTGLLIVVCFFPMMVSAAGSVESVIQAFPQDTGTGYQLEITRHEAPEYPRVALSREQNGWVDVKFTISPTGKVEDVQIIDANPKRVFERATLRAAKKWRFGAPADDGLNSAQSGVFRFSFELKEQ